MKISGRSMVAVGVMCLLPVACSSPKKSDEAEDVKSITSQSIAVPLVSPVEFATEFNQVVPDRAAKNVSRGTIPSRTVASAENPVSLPAGVTPVSGEVSILTYEVKSGDTLMKIAFQVLGDLTRWKEIAAENAAIVANPSVLSKGTLLKIKVFNVVQVKRNGTPYAIKRGDTLGKISNWVYGTITRWRELWNNNRELIHHPDKIYAGFKLYYLNSKTTPTRRIAEEPKPVDATK